MNNEEKILGILEKLTINVEQLTTDVSELKRDVSGLKEDVSGLKEDVSGLKADMTSVKARLDSLEEKTDNIQHTVTRIEQEHGKKIGVLFDAVDQLGTRLNDHDQKLDLLLARSEDHSLRLIRIEGEVSRHEEVILRRLP